MKTDTCDKCKATIVWAKSKKTGSNMMFDAVTGNGGFHKWSLFDDDGVLKAEYVRDGDELFYSSHFDTCEAKEGGGPHRQAQTTRAATSSPRPAASSPRAAPARLQAPSATVTARPPLSAVEVTVTFGDLIFSGTCRLVPVTHREVSDADDSPEAMEEGLVQDEGIPDL